MYDCIDTIGNVLFFTCIRDLTKFYFIFNLARMYIIYLTQLSIFKKDVNLLFYLLFFFKVVMFISVFFFLFYIMFTLFVFRVLLSYLYLGLSISVIDIFLILKVTFCLPKNENFWQKKIHVGFREKFSFWILYSCHEWTCRVYVFGLNNRTKDVFLLYV